MCVCCARVCKNMSILLSLLLLKFKLRPTKGLRLTRGRTSLPLSSRYFRILPHKAVSESVWCLCTCVFVCCQKFRTKAAKDKKGAAYFFPRRHEVLVGFEDVRQSFLDVFLLHAGQHSWGQEQQKTPLFSVEGRSWQSVGSVQPQCETSS